MDIFHNDGTGFVLITNGMLINKEIAGKLKKYRWYWIQVSIDSYNKSIHDKYRGINGSWEKAKQAVQILKEENLPVTIASVVTPDTFCDMDKMITFALNLKADAIIFSEVLYSGRACLNEEFFNYKQRMNIAINKLKKKYGDKIEIKKASTQIEQLNLIKDFAPFGMLIRPNGDVKLDCILPHIIGNIHHNSIQEIWNDWCKNYLSDEILQFIDRMKEDIHFYKNYIDSEIYLKD